MTYTDHDHAQQVATDLTEMTGRRWHPIYHTGRWWIALSVTTAEDLRGDLAEGREL